MASFTLTEIRLSDGQLNWLERSGLCELARHWTASLIGWLRLESCREVLHDVNPMGIHTDLNYWLV